MIWLRTSIAVGAAVLVAALGGCGGDNDKAGDSGQSTASGRDTAAAPEPIPSGDAPPAATILIRNDVDTFDAIKSVNESGAQQVFAAIYDTLVKTDPHGPAGEGILPGLAKSWTSTPTSAAFELHPGLTCADGGSLTPSGIAKSIERYGDPETGALYASRIFGPGGLKSVRADDARNTLTVTVAKPYTYLVEGMADAYIVCPDGLEDLKGLAQKPAGTGPYKLGSTKRGSSYTLERRADYKAFPEGMTIEQFPAKLTMRVVADDSTRANLLQTGDADIGSILGQDAVRLEGGGQLKKVPGAGFGVSALLFNQAKGHPGSDPSVRQALSLAVDGAAYTKAATFNVAEPIASVYTPNMDCYTKANAGLTPGFDVARAAKVLEQGGWTKGGGGSWTKGGRKLAVRLLGYDIQNNGPEYLVDALGKLGVDVKLKDTTYEGALGVLFGTGAWDAFVFPYNSPLYIPSIMVNQISGDPKASLNVGSVDNREYVSLVSEASAAGKGERCKLWGDAEAALLKAYDLKPLTWDKAAWFGKGMTFNANYWLVDLRTIRTSST